MSETRRFGEESKWIWLLLTTALFVVRLMPYAAAELWYDEVLTLTDFSLDLRGRGVIAAIFRNYPMANNHILNSAIYWAWVRILNFTIIPEQLLRLPSLLAGLGTLWLCMLHWRRWLGARTCVLGGILIALSPVFTAYAWQIRGYSLTIFLSALCISGALEYYSGQKRRGLVLGCVAGILLPLVMPSNLMLAPLAAILYESPFRRVREKLRAALPVLASFILGGAYYLTIWEQFLKTTKEPAGWESAWAVLGNLLLAFVAHTLPLFCIQLKQSISSAKNCLESLKSKEPSLALWEPALLLGPLVLIGAVLLLSRSGQAPYPRVFLVFLPQVTFGVLLALSRTDFSSPRYLALLFLVTINALLWERIPSELTQNELRQGRSPSNLLQQYYRGSPEIKDAIFFANEKFGLQKTFIITDEYDFPTARFYAALQGTPGDNVTTFNRSPEGCWKQLPYPRPTLLVIAKTPGSAAFLAKHAGASATPKTLRKLDIRTLYTLEE